MNEKLHQLVSNYYKGELASLSIKIVSCFFFIFLAFIFKYYTATEIVQHFGNNIIVLFGLILAKSLYQWFQYYKRRKIVLSNLPKDKILEIEYIKKREAILTNHRRFHVYALVFCCITIVIALIYINDSIQVLGILSALILLTGMLLSFSLFNSFRLSEYKNRINEL